VGLLTKYNLKYPNGSLDHFILVKAAISELYRYLIPSFAIWMVQVLAFNACNDLSVSSLSIANSPQAHITINGCEGATFSNINIQSPGDSPNTDGIDISSSKRILIKDSNIASGKPNFN